MIVQERNLEKGVTMRLDNVDLKRIEEIQTKVEENSALINQLVDKVIQPYCKDLDRYVSFIRDLLKDGENPPTDMELDDIVLNLSTYIYWASGACEQLGIKDDSSKAVYKEIYHTKRSEVSTGTVAELDSIQEQITNIVYNRSYKILKSKVENAQELLSSCKKVLSHRMQEQELTRIGG